jgi:hypothetical protein
MGEFKNVSLGDDEFRKLGEVLGEKREAYIDRLSSYMAQIGPAKAKKFKSHYATIRNWTRMDREKQGQIKAGGGNGTGTYRKSYSSRDAKDLAASEEADRINREWRASKNAKGKADGHSKDDAQGDHR